MILDKSLIKKESLRRNIKKSIKNSEKIVNDREVETHSLSNIAKKASRINNPKIEKNIEREINQDRYLRKEKSIEEKDMTRTHLTKKEKEDKSMKTTDIKSHIEDTTSNIMKEGNLKRKDATVKMIEIYHCQIILLRAALEKYCPFLIFFSFSFQMQYFILSFQDFSTKITILPFR